MKSFVIAATAIVALQFAGEATLAQPRKIEISGIPSCATCVVEFVQIATVGSPNDAVLMGEASQISRGPDNTFVANSLDGSQLIIFDSNGRYMGAFGRRGEGPGEFNARWARPFGVGRGDSLYVRAGSNLLIFSPSFVYGRTIALDSIVGGLLPSLDLNQITPLPDGNILLSATAGREVAARGNALGLLNATGGVIGAFGLPGAGDPNLCASCFARAVTLSLRNRSVLVSRGNSYVVEQYDLGGALQVTATVSSSPWMKTLTADSLRGSLLTERPAPQVSTAVAGQGGRVWVVGHTASRGWKALPPQGAGAGTASTGAGSFTVMRMGSEAMRRSMENSTANSATVVDLIDLDEKRVIASATFDATRYWHLDGDLFQQRKVDMDGVITFDVYRLNFRER